MMNRSVPSQEINSKVGKKGGDSRRGLPDQVLLMPLGGETSFLVFLPDISDHIAPE